MRRSSHLARRAEPVRRDTKALRLGSVAQALNACEKGDISN